MKGLSKPMQALDRHLREQNDRDRRASREWAPDAPMPSEPGYCRWCSRALIALLDGEPATYCQSGCAKNDEAPYVHHCPDCHRQFWTGKRLAVLCHECDKRDAERMSAGAAEPTYHYSRFGRGGFR